ncbi:MAG: hypothetical protein KAQ96_01110 [Thermoplasmata archaeon]|nr:hypothetical protein [Thermoplasmata archaeon]
MTNRVFLAFYSRKGHTRELGLAICQGLKESSVEVACLELEPERQINVIQASASSFTHSAEPIKECQVDLDGVNLLVLGTPIWGGLPAPYMRSLLDSVKDLKGLPVVLFATCAYGDRNAAHELREMVRSRGGRPLEYHLWRIRKEGASGCERATERIVGATLDLLPSKDPIGLVG